MRTKKLLAVVKTNAERILKQQYIDVILETRKDRYDIKNINGHRETKLVENILSIVEVSFKECIISCYNILEKKCE